MKANVVKHASKYTIQRLMGVYKVGSLPALLTAIKNDIKAPLDSDTVKASDLPTYIKEGITFEESHGCFTVFRRGEILFNESTSSLKLPTVATEAVPTQGTRHVQRKVGHNQWENIQLMDLTSGATFRMFEATGEPVYDAYGRSQWIAAGKPYRDANNEPTINVYG